jgi:hypothetical protein
MSATLVRENERLQNLSDDLGCPGWLHLGQNIRRGCRRPSECFRQVSRQQLHREEEATGGLTRVLHRHDMRMLQAGEHPGFAPKPFAESGVARQFRWNYLQGDITAEMGMLRFVNHAHATTTEQPHDHVVAEGFTGRQFAGGHVARPLADEHRGGIVQSSKRFGATLRRLADLPSQ